MIRLLSICFLLISLSACQPEGRVYVKHKKLSHDVEWVRTDVREFKVPVEDNSIPYNFSLSFRFAQGYQYRVALVQVVETSPSGKKTTKDYELKIRDENDKYIGDAGYDIWDSEHLVEPNKKYEEQGAYTYVISHKMPKDPLYFAMEIGVILDKIGE